MAIGRQAEILPPRKPRKAKRPGRSFIDPHIHPDFLAATGVVRTYFDERASNWSSRYDGQGPLAPRLQLFENRLLEMRPPPATLLDFGCGTGNIAMALARRGYVVSGCDVSARMLDMAKSVDSVEQVRWRTLDASRVELPFSDSQFDIIVASSVLEYLVDPFGSLQEFHRVLRPAGLLVCTVPNPRHIIRRFERVAQLLTRRPFVETLDHRSSRLSAYLQYLRLSVNRFDLEEWNRLANFAGFSGTLIHLDDRRDPLLAIAFPASEDSK